jgi:Tol biopolymer transport system component
MFQPMADALSPDGSKILFRKVSGMYIQKDLWVLDLTTGNETKVEGMPNGYFYNTGGEWSPDGTKFAFYANGFTNIDKNKIYRDNNLLSIIDTADFKITSYEKPQVTANLYPLGALHWIGNENILTYLDDNSSWSFKVPSTGGGN